MTKKNVNKYFKLNTRLIFFTCGWLHDSLFSKFTLAFLGGWWPINSNLDLERYLIICVITSLAQCYFQKEVGEREQTALK